ncbi:MAG TPA: NUDIX domain-containing protein [Stellaceae bacterium]|nr:NUDIX domain-containing protein [Stellaceae bacterium]
MNDISEPVRARPVVVRARDAASLILLRGHGDGLELLAGRRPGHVRFMPGVWVFPGGAVDAPDNRPWQTEIGAESLTPRLQRCARAALRETWEEVGVAVGRKGSAAAAGKTEAERAYVERGAVADLSLLTYIGRAITPSTVFRRFNTRFFVAEGEHVIGDPASSDELEDVGWHPIGRSPLSPFRDVSQFMLAQAVALREGASPFEAMLFATVAGKRRVRPCWEGRR